MPVTEKVYPEWVQAYRTKGMTVKMKGDTYYLYSRTSKRVAGKKYPQPVDTYVGIITPEGIVKTNRKKVSFSDIEVYEYGFSKAVWDLCPDSWKKPLGKDWENILRIVLHRHSPESYLYRNIVLKEEDFKCQFQAQASSLSRRIYKAHGVDFDELDILKSIYLVVFENKTVVSRVSPEQKELLDRIGVCLEE